MTSCKYHPPFLVVDMKDQAGYHTDAQMTDPPSKIFLASHTEAAE